MRGSAPWRWSCCGTMEKREVWISLSWAPADFSAAIALATRSLFWLIAASTVSATVCTPSVKLTRSGAALERPVPMTLTASRYAAGSRGALTWAAAGTAQSAMTRTAKEFFIEMHLDGRDRDRTFSTLRAPDQYSTADRPASDLDFDG